MTLKEIVMKAIKECLENKGRKLQENVPYPLECAEFFISQSKKNDKYSIEDYCEEMILINSMYLNGIEEAFDQTFLKAGKQLKYLPRYNVSSDELSKAFSALSKASNELDKTISERFKGLGNSLNKFNKELIEEERNRSMILTTATLETKDFQRFLNNNRNSVDVSDEYINDTDWAELKELQKARKQKATDDSLHEDGHGSFIIKEHKELNIHWLKNAVKGYTKIKI